MESEVFICGNCEKKFNRKDNLKRHIFKQHPITPKPFKCPKFTGLCPLCRSTSPDILNHFSDHHDIEIQLEQIEFDNAISFSNWKKKIEKSTKSLFVISKSRKEKKRKWNFRTLKFTCHRSGIFKSKGKNIRLRKSNKIGGCCPASIYVTVQKNTQIHYVTYIKTHVGHKDDNLSHVNLTEQDTSKGITFDGILHNTRDLVISLEDNNIAPELENTPEIQSHLTNNEGMNDQQLVNENIEIFAFLKNAEFQSKSISEDVDILRKEFEDLLANVSTKEHLNIVRQLLKTGKIRLNAAHASGGCVGFNQKTTKNLHPNSKYTPQKRFYSTKKKNTKTEHEINVPHFEGEMVISSLLLKEDWIMV